MELKISQMGSIRGTWYVVDLGDNKIHMLNWKSLVWNMKRWGLSKQDITNVSSQLDHTGTAKIEFKRGAA